MACLEFFFGLRFLVWEQSRCFPLLILLCFLPPPVRWVMRSQCGSPPPPFFFLWCSSTPLLSRTRGDLISYAGYPRGGLPLQSSVETANLRTFYGAASRRPRLWSLPGSSLSQRAVSPSFPLPLHVHTAPNCLALFRGMGVMRLTTIRMRVSNPSFFFVRFPGTDSPLVRRRIRPLFAHAPE